MPLRDSLLSPTCTLDLRANAESNPSAVPRAQETAQLPPTIPKDLVHAETAIPDMVECHSTCTKVGFRLVLLTDRSCFGMLVVRVASLLSPMACSALLGLFFAMPLQGQCDRAANALPCISNLAKAVLLSCSSSCTASLAHLP